MMNHGQMVFVACALEVGAFSGERTFRLKLVEPPVEYAGIAPVHYCLTSEKAPLRTDQPAPGHPISGFVEAYFISNGGDEASVELPDGVAVRVKLSQLLVRQERSQEPDYVSLRP
jgi:hypothetical protein